MTRQEYEQVKNMSYDDYCNYLQNKYGKVPARYGSELNKRSEEGLFIHHMREDEVASLSNREIAKNSNPEYQEGYNLVYANYLEHLLLHILIGEETAGTKNLGLNGPFMFIVPALMGYFNNNNKNKVINEGYYKAIEGQKEVFDLLFERYNKVVCNVDITLEHNQTLYPQVEKNLNENNKALVVLGTGLGKTTTALQYIWKHQCRALVIGPNNIIKTGWEKYSDYCDTTTYQSFANEYQDIDYTQYGLVVLDEAHHAGYDEETEKGAEVWSKGIKYIINKGIKVLGLTATPERSDKINIAKTLFKDCVCEGLSVEDAIEQDIIHKFSYITALYDTDGIVEEVKKTYDCGDEVITKLIGQLDLAINNTPTMKEIFNKYMPKNKRKGIIFIQEIEDKKYVMDIFKDIYPNIEYRAIDSKMPYEEVKQNRQWFENTDEGYLLAVNMVSEGVHYKGVNTLIMFRRTSSYLVYTQQLGRIITLTKDENPNAIVFDLVNNADNVVYNDRKINKKKEHSIARLIKVLKTSALKSNQIIVADETREIVNVIRKIKQENDRSWQDWEIEIIKEFYPTEGAEGCMERINKR